jgi:hypothetical protein
LDLDFNKLTVFNFIDNGSSYSISEKDEFSKQIQSVPINRVCWTGKLDFIECYEIFLPNRQIHMHDHRCCRDNESSVIFPNE